MRIARRRSHRSGSSQRGASLVEFALVMPHLAMLLLGMVSTGLVYNQKLDLTHATREGARYGATISPYQQWQSGSWATNVRDLVIARSSEKLTAADVWSLVVSSSATTSAVYSRRPHGQLLHDEDDGTTCYADSYSQYSLTDTGLRAQVTVARPGRSSLRCCRPST
jgi:Flp pilus assembly protein TadG